MGDHLPGCLRYTIDVGDPEDRFFFFREEFAVKINALNINFVTEKFHDSATFFMCTFIDIFYCICIYIFMIYVFRLSRHNSHVVVSGESSNADTGGWMGFLNFHR